MAGVLTARRWNVIPIGIEKISTETENVSVLTPYRIMYATVTLSYFTYVERHEDIISTRTSSETLIKKYLSIEQKLCLFFLLFFHR